MANEYNESDHGSEYDSDYDSDADSRDSYERPGYYSRYVLGCAEIHSDKFHGGSYENNEDDAAMAGRFLFMLSIPREWEVIRRMSFNRRLSIMYRYRTVRGVLTHPKIRHYSELLFCPLNIEPQILEIVEGPYDYYSCIIKTTYLRQLQRKWKKIYAERQRVLKERKNPMEQLKRKLTGRYNSLWK